MEKITYLIGAGASAQVLPLIKDQDNNPGLPTKLIDYYHTRQVQYREHNGWDVAKSEIFRKTIALTKKFGTPDLLAKFLLETGEDEKYLFLKQLVSKYILEEEGLDDQRGIAIFKENIDPRVIPFLTTISSGGRLLEQVKMVSWNYDTQIEKGARALKHISGRNTVIDNFHAWPYRSMPTDSNFIDYFLLHLNGVAGYYYDERMLAAEDEAPFKFYDKEPLLSFAWEEDHLVHGKKTFLENRYKLLEKMVRDTSILVVIGYSFPFFNRNADKKIFQFFNNKLRKIYFQDPHLDGAFLKTQFDLAEDVEIYWIKNVQQYYVPFEM